MKPNEMRIRIVGTEENCERILSLLKPEAKQHGNRKLLKVRKFSRDPEQNKYSSIFGTADTAYYVQMTIQNQKDPTEKFVESLPFM